MSHAEVYMNNVKAGYLTKDAKNYHFKYDISYLESADATSVSLILPLQEETFESPHLFACFSEMLSEGALKKEQCLSMKIDENDYFTRLLKTCSKDTIGAITIKEIIS